MSIQAVTTNYVGVPTNLYCFTGRRWEPDTGLHIFRARYFSGSGGLGSHPNDEYAVAIGV